MSIIGNLRSLSDDDLTILLEQPDNIAAYLYEDDSGFGPHGDIDIDKAWHGLHFLLCGSATRDDWPFAFLVNWGRPIGDEDVGYGPARGFFSGEVKQISEALNQLDHARLETRFDPETMAREEIYPMIWAPEEARESLEYLLGYFDSMRGFINATAEADGGLLVYLS
jgi:hypothetical protein